MATLPIGLQTRCLGEPLRRAVATAASLGADGVEIDLRNEVRVGEFGGTALRAFRRLLEEHRMRVLATAFPTRRGLDDPEELDRRVRALCEAMSFAYQIGARVVVTRLESIPATGTDADAALRESLHNLSRHGDRVGARVALASGAPAAEQAKLLDQLPEGTLGVALHPGLLVGAGEAVADAAGTLGERVLCVYGADAVREVASAPVEVALGRGEADLPEVLAALEERAYQGPVIVERREGADRRGDLENAVAYLRAL